MIDPARTGRATRPGAGGHGGSWSPCTRRPLDRLTARRTHRLGMRPSAYRSAVWEHEQSCTDNMRVPRAIRSAQHPQPRRHRLAEPAPSTRAEAGSAAGFAAASWRTERSTSCPHTSRTPQALARSACSSSTSARSSARSATGSALTAPGASSPRSSSTSASTAPAWARGRFRTCVPATRRLPGATLRPGAPHGICCAACVFPQPPPARPATIRADHCLTRCRPLPDQRPAARTKVLDRTTSEVAGFDRAVPHLLPIRLARPAPHLGPRSGFP